MGWNQAAGFGVARGPAGRRSSVAAAEAELPGSCSAGRKGRALAVAP